MTHAEGEGHSFVLRPGAMYPGEYKIVAERLFEEFTNAPAPRPEPSTKPPLTNLTGHWEIDISFLASSTTWRLYLDNNGNELAGVYASPVVPDGTLTGNISGHQVEIRSRGRHEVIFNYVFTGTVRDDRMEGMVGSCPRAYAVRIKISVLTFTGTVIGPKRTVG
jgi:D-glucosaminate-6-phosphate ammonia-lyase